VSPSPTSAAITGTFMPIQGCRQHHERAIELAADELGSGIECYYDEILLAATEGDASIEDAPWIVFLLSGPKSMKTASITFPGSIDRPVVQFSRISEGTLRSRRVHQSAKPWLADDTWKTLVDQSWRRMSPFEGAVTLHALPKSLAGRFGIWRVAYTSFGPRDESVLEQKTTIFAFAKGELEEVPV
jgi:hypothetical protein